MYIYKVCFVEIDSEFYFDNISQDLTSWNVDYDWLHNEMPEVEEYLMKHQYQDEVNALKNGIIDFLTLEQKI